MMFNPFKRMDWKHAAIFCASLACTGTAYASRDAAPLAGFISLPALLCAFGGAGLVLSFQKPRPISNWRLFQNTVFCALLGTVGAPIGVRVIAGYVPGFAGPGAEVFVAFAVGAVLQIFMPWLIENHADVLGSIFRTKKKEQS